jgi:indole-3-glycerol phosphate synthase
MFSLRSFSLHSRLKEILAEKRNEVAALKKRGMPSVEDIHAPAIRDFKAAIFTKGRISLIAEIKFASPSAGTIRQKGDPVPIGLIYEKVGAAAISLLTDEKFFGGDLNNLPRMKKAVSLPILRKDFVIDEIQVRESAVFGADAILLIVRLLSREQLKDLLDACLDLGMAALVEVHDRQDLEKAVSCRAEIIGINNRNLDTFQVNLNTTLELAPLVPDRHVLVSESGIRDESDIRLLNGCGIRAVLVGSSLMKSDNIEKKTGALVEACNVAKE